MAAPGRVVFIGAVHEAAPALSALLESDAEVAAVFTLPETRAGSSSGFVDLAPIAQRHRVPVERVEDINAPSVLAHIGRLHPDLLVVVGWSRLLGKRLLSIPPRGCVGFHASLLPRHRGRAPVNWAMLRGETRTGNTMFMLSPDADMGDIVDQRVVSIEDDDTCADVYAKVGAAGAEMLGAHLTALLAGAAIRMPQAAGDDPPLPKRTPAMGITVWNRPARDVHNWIRALTLPYPGAFSYLQGRTVMLWRSAVPGRDEPVGVPGRILSCDRDGLRVGTSDGSLLITTVSDAGDSPQPAHRWFEHADLAPGAAFDPVDEPTARWALGASPAPVTAS